MPKSEWTAVPSLRQVFWPSPIRLAFGFRVSDFLRISDFGLRISALRGLGFIPDPTDLGAALREIGLAAWTKPSVFFPAFFS